MVKLLKYGAFFVFFLVFASCRNQSEGQLTFDTLKAEKSVSLTNEPFSPQCSVSLNMACASKKSGELGQKINEAVVAHIFGQEGLSLQAAMDQFAEHYTTTYRSNMRPLYNEDRADSTKRSWYEFHYIINSTVEHRSRRTLAYLTSIDYCEGHTQSIQQLMALNFYAETAQLIELKDIFVDGYESQLTPVLLKELMEKAEAKNLDKLKEKGYLNTMDIYVPDNFIVGDDTITFIFNPSEIASLEMGTIELVLSYAQIKKLIKTTFLNSLQ